MSFQGLISLQELTRARERTNWIVIDCRFDLLDTEKGRRAYLDAHIPGALYAHLDDDLSGPVIPGQTGRHPLPDIQTCAHTFSRWGIAPDVQVVTYDDKGGALAAARLWWMLRWLGHKDVAVLDGGWSAWKTAGYPTRSGPETRSERKFLPRPQAQMVVTTEDIVKQLNDAALQLIDVRQPERYRGEYEPYDPVAGHIPGAVSAPATENTTEDGYFRSSEELRRRYEPLLGTVPPSHTVFYCGSGVNAAQSVLALQHAGLGEGRLYAGSWSEWCADPTRPTESE